jgi:phage-related protein
MYVATFADAVYVLHAFAKKTAKTAQRDIRLARTRFEALLAERKASHDE